MIIKRNRKQWKKEHKKSGLKPLNSKGHHSVACVSWKVRGYLSVSLSQDPVKEGEEPKKWEISDMSRSISGGITISDCNKSVHLDLDAYTIKDAENALSKIDKLIEELIDCRGNYAKAVKLYKYGKKYAKLYNAEKEKATNIEESELEKLLNEKLIANK